MVESSQIESNPGFLPKGTRGNVVRVVNQRGVQIIARKMGPSVKFEG